MGLTRFGVSMEPGLARSFDRLIKDKGYANRSEAIRDLVRDNLVQRQWAAGEGEAVGTVNLVFDHHEGDVTERLNSIEHDNLKLIVSTLHVHLDRHHCLEVLVLRGSPSDITSVANLLISARGVKHGKLTVAASGKELG